ncbi:MAG TPA: Gfo/Idh/MocA family oxidoreductase [Rhizobiaceae bacterium]|nr:Gfo/Idh/MocA family oxidoreductase [Rhizobiaceae bacterium]
MIPKAPRVRIGFIGAGAIAERHVGTLTRIPQVEIAGFSDVDFERAQGLASRVSARAYRSHEDMLQLEGLDAVYICVPPFAHGEPERAVIDAGLPFFVEKPLSLDISTAEAIARSVQDQSMATAVGYHWRYLDTVEEARTLLRSNPPQLISGYWLDRTPPPQWWWREDRSGGQVVEQATHIIDLARYLVGEIVEVCAFTTPGKPREEFPGLDISTSTAASLRFSAGAVGTLGATCQLRWCHRVGVHLFADGLAIELSDRDIMVDVGRGRPVRPASEDPVYLEDSDFIDAVRGLSNRVRSPYSEALKTHRVALAIAQSARSRRPVSIAEDTLEPARV